MLTKKSLIGLGAVAAAGGVAMWALLAQRLTERGLDADANGTAGFTGTGDYVQAAAGLLLVVGGIALAVYGLVRKSRSQAPRP